MERVNLEELIIEISSGVPLGQAISRLRVIVMHLADLAGDEGTDYISSAAGMLRSLHHPEDGPAALATAFRRVGE